MSLERLDGRTVKARMVWSSNLRPAKSYTALQTVCHCFNIYANNCVALALYMTQSWAPQTRYTFQRNTVSIIKCLVWRSAYSSMKCHEIFGTTIISTNHAKM